MTLASFEEVVSFDDEGIVDGFQFNGRERRLQEWREKKESAEFDKLITKLRRHKNYRAWYLRHKDDPVWRERFRKYVREQKRKHSVRRNAEARQKRIEAHASIVNVCEECGTKFSFEYGQRKKRSRFCSMKCRNRASGRSRVRTYKKSTRVTSFERIKQFLLENPGKTATEIRKALELNRGTMLCALRTACEKGELVKKGDRGGLYFVATLTVDGGPKG